MHIIFHQNNLSCINNLLQIALYIIINFALFVSGRQKERGVQFDIIDCQQSVMNNWVTSTKFYGIKVRLILENA